MSFFNTREVKAARKDRVCEDCGQPIKKGEPYRSYSQSFDGEFFYGGAHGDCMDWGNRVMNCDEGRGTIEQSDPEDELEPEDVAEAIRRYPPAPALYERLPARWKAFVDEALRLAPPNALLI